MYAHFICIRTRRLFTKMQRSLQVYSDENWWCGRGLMWVGPEIMSLLGGRGYLDTEPLSFYQMGRVVGTPSSRPSSAYPYWSPLNSNHSVRQMCNWTNGCISAICEDVTAVIRAGSVFLVTDTTIPGIAAGWSYVVTNVDTPKGKCSHSWAQI